MDRSPGRGALLIAVRSQVQNELEVSHTMVQNYSEIALSAPKFCPVHGVHLSDDLGGLDGPGEKSVNSTYTPRDHGSPRPHPPEDIEAEQHQHDPDRELEGGVFEVVELPKPCLLAIQTGANQVRYASLKGIMQAKKKPVDVKTAADLGVSDVGAANAKVTVDKIYSPPRSATADILSGSTDEIVSGLMGKIKELGVL